jgi:hypothetical protein
VAGGRREGLQCLGQGILFALPASRGMSSSSSRTVASTPSPPAALDMDGATADAVAAVLGEDAREQTIVSIVGVPDGRTGVVGAVT